MMQFSFTTNIEKRSPWTGNVYMVDRMTSSYAMAHPFNLDEFIESVWEKWQGAETRETIRKYFNYGLGRLGEKFSTHCPAKHRDKVVKDRRTGIGQIEFGKWPEHVGGLRPALIEAWNKGADYHVMGFRQGDLLPEKLPSHTITRLGNGEWIALFPKDMGLLENHENDINDYICNTTEQVDRDSDTENTILGFRQEESECVGMTCSDFDAQEEAQDSVAEQTEETDTTEQAADIEAIETIEAECSENVPLDVTDADPDSHISISNEPEEAPVNFKPIALEHAAAEAVAQREAIEDEIPVSPLRPSRQEIQQQHRMTWAERQQREAQEAEEEQRRLQRRKVLAAVGATIATLVLVNYFGLIGPALFGLVAGGLIKG